MRGKFSFLTITTFILGGVIYGVSVLDTHLKRQDLSESEKEAFVGDTFVLTSLYAATVLMLIYCLFNSITISSMYHKNVLFAEVQDARKSNITRTQAKINMQELYGQGDELQLFDNAWYDRRESFYISDIKKDLNI